MRGARCFYEDRDGAFTETTYGTLFLGYPYFSEGTKVFNSLLGTDYRKIDRIYDVMPKHGLYRARDLRKDRRRVLRGELVPWRAARSRRRRN